MGRRGQPTARRQALTVSHCSTLFALGASVGQPLDACRQISDDQSPFEHPFQHSNMLQC